MVVFEPDGAGAPGDPDTPGEPAGPGTGMGTTVVDGDVAGGVTTVVLRSHALRAATAVINAATCMSLLFMNHISRCLVG